MILLLLALAAVPARDEARGFESGYEAFSWNGPKNTQVVMGQEPDLTYGITVSYEDADRVVKSVPQSMLRYDAKKKTLSIQGGEALKLKVGHHFDVRFDAKEDVLRLKTKYPEIKTPRAAGFFDRRSAKPMPLACRIIGIKKDRKLEVADVEPPVEVFTFLQVHEDIDALQGRLDRLHGCAKRAFPKLD